MLLDSSITDIIAKIHSFEPQIDGLKKALLKYKENVEKKVYANFLQAEALRFSKLIDNLQSKLKSKPNIPEYSRQATIDDDFCNSVKSKLQAWNVIGNVPVFYEDKEFDFNIGGQKRTMCGKGTRGVTCTAIIMTLIEYCKKMVSHLVSCLLWIHHLLLILTMSMLMQTKQLRQSFLNIVMSMTLIIS